MCGWIVGIMARGQGLNLSGEIMKMTIRVDDELLARALELTGEKNKSALVSRALRELVSRESARSLAKLGRTEPQLRQVPRRRLS
jgi:Arc/MetJ family transcription regulator